MNEMLEKLWYDHFAEECAVLDTREEQALAKRAAESRGKLNRSLTGEQRRIMDAYAEALYEMQASLIKKAFLRGAELSASFLLELRGTQI